MIINGKKSDSIAVKEFNKPGKIQLNPNECYGAELNIKSKAVLHTLTTGGTTSTLTAFFKDGWVVLGLCARINTAVTTGGDRTTITFGDGAVTWTTKAALVAGTTFTLADAPTQVKPKIYAADTNLVLTVSGGASGNITGGVVRIVCYYYDIVAPAA
jgi:hypothetical protein